MRLGIIGPAGSNTELLEQATSLLIDGLEADAVVYLGIDAAVDAFVEKRRASGSNAVQDHVIQTAIDGDPGDIRRIQRELRQARDLAAIRLAPEPPHRAVEMVDDRIVLIVYDKALLGEDDIVSANLVLYGKANAPLFKRFGPRCFFTPGPLSSGQLALVEEEAEGGVVLRGLDTNGVFTWREPILGRTAKVTVS